MKLTRIEVITNDTLFKKALVVGKLIHSYMTGVPSCEVAEVSAVDYATHFGEDGLDDLVWYVKHSIQAGTSKAEIGATLGHDITGMADRCFSPRTAGYTKYMEAKNAVK